MGLSIYALLDFEKLARLLILLYKVTISRRLVLLECTPNFGPMLC